MPHSFMRVVAVAALVAALGPGPGRVDALIISDFNIVTPVPAQVYNDRIGNSRFFSGPNTDRVRISAFPLPSPDSDVFPVTSGPTLFQSTNGSSTTATFAHPILPGPQAMTFVGLTSGRGGGRNEFTFSFNRASALIAPLLDAWQATPFQITVANPEAPGGTTAVTFSAPSFNKDALPPFVTDLRLTGGGLHPRLDWEVPGGPISLSGVSIQIRRIDAETPDRTRITESTLVHNRTLAPSATSYTLDEVFSNAGLPGFPAGLEFGQRYEIAVQLDAAVGGHLQGRARTFFEFTPLGEDVGNVSVFLPSVGADGVFKFDVGVARGEKIAIDPVVAIGYDFRIGFGDPLFASAILPDIGDGLFDLLLFDGAEYVFQTVLAAGAEYLFPGGGVDRFRVLGIETGAGIDPADTTAFITTLTFAGTGRFTGTMAPIAQVVDDSAVVSGPGALPLLGSGLAVLGVAWRRWCGRSQPARGVPRSRRRQANGAC